MLLSWVLPKGPSLDPSIKRLAVQTEDHPIEYADFEGVIPTGECGAGTVELWDRRTQQPDDPDVDTALRKGELKFTLFGERLIASWVLLQFHGRFGKRLMLPSWLLIKRRDANASLADLVNEGRRSMSTRYLRAS